MCAAVKVNGKWIDRAAELEAELGVPLIADPPYTLPISPRACLCPVDVAATAKAAGRTATMDLDFDWVIGDRPEEVSASIK